MKIIKFKDCIYDNIDGLLWDNEILKNVKIGYHSYGQAQKGFNCLLKYSNIFYAIKISPEIKNRRDIIGMIVGEKVCWRFQMCIYEE
jgi:hypothetical protein